MYGTGQKMFFNNHFRKVMGQSQNHNVFILDIKDIQWLQFALLVGEEVPCPHQMSLWNL